MVTAPPSPCYSQDDRQLTERRLQAALKGVLRSVGLPGKLHTFRHSFISHALLQRVPEATVREWVGHIDPEILRHYTHVHDEASQAAMQRLARANEHLQPGEQNDGNQEAKPAQLPGGRKWPWRKLKADLEM